ncbi:hypothetical protein [Yersinia enterocolitica]|uniref:hypothetical protein n=1 Tax=Yersinia enterocolitica TaxID=630 RepID=UPI0005E290A3|nr:hypothetical protein [Yersinia enterocolitica]EKN3461468.1 hypothetical protein [Yersinia enterocolitica]EKN4067538.1 hypothetical protein [Yersinia enterocolitica]EKN4157332.1 hypothetical protein [Yersinia enterocolitica]EKN4712542.1 hypothetical protein [Yersinia enterocolitica]EKN6244612.1 hypothetical protein [Yersinia enterocolitica]
MAKTLSKQQASINELGGLPPEFAADTQQEQTVVTDNNATQPDPETQENTTESELGSDEPADDSDEMELVVVKGQTLRHSGETHAENSRLFLSHEDAERLINLGVVADVKALRQQAASAIGPSVTVDDGVKINRGS